MSRAAYVLKNVRNVPANVKRALVNEALALDIAMGDVVGEVLANHWHLSYERSGERSQGAERDTDQLLFRIPETVNFQIWAAAREQKITQSSVVLKVLSEHFGLVYTPTRRRGRRPANA